MDHYLLPLPLPGKSLFVMLISFNIFALFIFAHGFLNTILTCIIEGIGEKRFTTLLKRNIFPSSTETAAQLWLYCHNFVPYDLKPLSRIRQELVFIWKFADYSFGLFFMSPIFTGIKTMDIPHCTISCVCMLGKYKINSTLTETLYSSPVSSVNWS